MDFKDRKVVVTGGAGALGRAVVARLSEAGARIRVPIRGNAPPPDFLASESVKVIPRCDLTNEADVARLYAGINDLWASIHIAGGFAMSDLAATDKTALMRMLDMNLVSCHLCCRAAAAAFDPAGGRIVNVAARPGLEPRSGAGMSAYTIAKAGVAALTEALAAELVGRGILVNAVAPSIIDTPSNRADMPKADHSAWPKPDEIAATILHLASPENTVTRGAVIPVYGKT
ncbi:SDR family NAD(P)-dependent oxidoreductase [uncultured Ferrovibrio sp.]|jgi:NAD(P)-dependent dehydrogenase (short-subunit alcohol dehydrogenase family)|uniref:SDR family NAD(P)-dependent oxidoreductase n=1 Tax=uncultured Ferrovibrio sp. TaxID=1576913 RepID=UPI00263196D2|nr:SDR family NAD(P)-dependent oxidoreductase [uncultured Ferrovibrio sp.]